MKQIAVIIFIILNIFTSNAKMMFQISKIEVKKYPIINLKLEPWDSDSGPDLKARISYFDEYNFSRKIFSNELYIDDKSLVQKNRIFTFKEKRNFSIEEFERVIFIELMDDDPQGEELIVNFSVNHVDLISKEKKNNYLKIKDKYYLKKFHYETKNTDITLFFEWVDVE